MSKKKVAHKATEKIADLEDELRLQKDYNEGLKNRLQHLTSQVEHYKNESHRHWGDLRAKRVRLAVANKRIDDLIQILDNATRQRKAPVVNCNVGHASAHDHAKKLAEQIKCAERGSFGFDGGK